MNISLFCFILSNSKIFGEKVISSKRFVYGKLNNRLRSLRPVATFRKLTMTSNFVASRSNENEPLVFQVGKKLVRNC